jgi:hypothetical protein
LRRPVAAPISLLLHFLSRNQAHSLLPAPIRPYLACTSPSPRLISHSLTALTL